MTFFTEVGTKNPKIHMKKQKNPKITKMILNNKNKDKGITIPDFKIYHRAVRSKTP